MRILGLVPARGGSKRIKDKNIIDFLGRPIIDYSLKAMSASGVYDEIHVSTDSKKIKEVVENLGYSIPFMRTAYAGDNDGILDLGRWVLNEYANRGEKFDAVGFVMACSPLMEAIDYKTGFETFKKNGCAPQLAVSDYPAPPQQALLFSNGEIVPEREEYFKARSQELPKSVFDTGAFAFFLVDDLQSCRADRIEGYRGFPVARYKAVDINVPSDLAFCELLFLGSKA